jgi:hypothetical protein
MKIDDTSEQKDTLNVETIDTQPDNSAVDSKDEAALPRVIPQVVTTSKPKKAKSFKLVLGLSVLLLLVIGGYFGFAAMSNEEASVAPTAQQAPEVAKLGVAVVVLDGSAQYKIDDGDWALLTTDTELAEGATIITNPGARVVLGIDDGSAVRLNESTSVTLESLAADDVRIINKAGQVYSRVVASERRYTVSIEDTDYTALGTAYNTINTETNKGVQVMQSSVSIKGVDTAVTEGKQYYVAHAQEALKNKLSDVPVEELKSNSFMVWNLEQDEKNETFKANLGYLQKIKETTPVEPVPEVASPQIKLSASNSDKGVVLKWSLSGVSAPEGFKIVRSKKSTTPTYGKDDATFADAKARSYTWGANEGGLYYYRICAYKPSDKGCTPYSNTVKLESQAILPEQPVQGTVSLTLSGTVASWTDTGTAPHGWKVVVSSAPNPTYGGNNIKTYYTNNSPKTIEGLSDGTYYVRVCKYTASQVDNGCTNYSNEETLVIGSI